MMGERPHRDPRVTLLRRARDLLATLVRPAYGLRPIRDCLVIHFRHACDTRATIAVTRLGKSISDWRGFSTEKTARYR